MIKSYRLRQICDSYDLDFTKTTYEDIKISQTEELIESVNRLATGIFVSFFMLIAALALLAIPSSASAYSGENVVISSGALIVGQEITAGTSECIAFMVVEDGMTICSHYTNDAPTGNLTCDATITVDYQVCSQWVHTVMSDVVNAQLDIGTLLIEKLTIALMLLIILAAFAFAAMKWSFRTMWPLERYRPSKK